MCFVSTKGTAQVRHKKKGLQLPSAAWRNGKRIDSRVTGSCSRKEGQDDPDEITARCAEPGETMVNRVLHPLQFASRLARKKSLGILQVIAFWVLQSGQVNRITLLVPIPITTGFTDCFVKGNSPIHQRRFPARPAFAMVSSSQSLLIRFS